MAKKKTAGQPAGPSLLAAIESAGQPELDELQAGLDALDAQIQTLQHKRQAIEQAKKMISMKLFGRRQAAGRGTQVIERQRKIAEYLKVYGPVGPKAMAEGTGIPLGSMNKLLQHAWFQKTDDGWVVTDRAAA